VPAIERIAAVRRTPSVLQRRPARARFSALLTP
jgi:hypothetical protein